MKFILDASVPLKTVIPESNSSLAIKLMDDYRRGIHELIAPDIFSAEIGHALTRAERQRRISAPDGWRFWSEIMADPPEFHPHLPMMQRAFDISSSRRIGLYDCIYVALAEQEDCDLVTADEKLIKNLPGFPIVALENL
ncbi:MAG: putative nucleic acid-binding protein contains domain [Planctomycetaceae bacterium]|nr:putative nucleic acid-binding protein contains domain [Planctomycetaceae bacterium]